MEISSRRTMLTILDICLDKREREMTISHGIVPRLLDSRHLEKVSIMDVHSRLLEMKTLDSCFLLMA